MKEVTAIDILIMHSGLLPETIKKSYSWVIAAMNEYASRKVLEHEQEQSTLQEDVKQCWVCSNNGVRRYGESCNLNNNCKFPKCLNQIELSSVDLETFKDAYIERNEKANSLQEDNERLKEALKEFAPENTPSWIAYFDAWEKANNLLTSTKQKEE